MIVTPRTCPARVLDCPLPAGKAAAENASVESLSAWGHVPLLAVACAAALLFGVEAVALPAPPLQRDGNAAIVARTAQTNGLWFAVQSEAWDDQAIAGGQAAGTRAAAHSLGWPRRLSVELKIQNRGTRTRRLAAHDFLLTDGGAIRLPAQTAFSATALPPREYLHAVLRFSVPHPASNLQLVWSQGGQEVRLGVGRPSEVQGNSISPSRGEPSCFPGAAVRCAESFRAPSGRRNARGQ